LSELKRTNLSGADLAYGGDQLTGRDPLSAIVHLAIEYLRLHLAAGEDHETAAALDELRQSVAVRRREPAHVGQEDDAGALDVGRHENGRVNHPRIHAGDVCRERPQGLLEGERLRLGPLQPRVPVHEQHIDPAAHPESAVVRVVRRERVGADLGGHGVGAGGLELVGLRDGRLSAGGDFPDDLGVERGSAVFGGGDGELDAHVGHVIGSEVRHRGNEVRYRAGLHRLLGGLDAHDGQVRVVLGVLGADVDQVGLDAELLRVFQGLCERRLLGVAESPVLEPAVADNHEGLVRVLRVTQRLDTACQQAGGEKLQVDRVGVFELVVQPVDEVGVDLGGGGQFAPFFLAGHHGE